jgi:hypothetical protein
VPERKLDARAGFGEGDGSRDFGEGGRHGGHGAERNARVTIRAKSLERACVAGR